MSALRYHDFHLTGYDVRKLEAQKLCAWEISSSIGFAGIVIAKFIDGVTDQFAQHAH